VFRIGEIASLVLPSDVWPGVPGGPGRDVAPARWLALSL